MKKKMKINNIVVFIIVLVWFNINAQVNTEYVANIKNDSILGFKKIALTPKLRVIVNSNFSDLRILNNKEQQTPYFIQDYGYKEATKFVEIPSKITYTKKQTLVSINNPSQKLYTILTFKLSNTNAFKYCKVEGSNDNDKWFVVSERIHLYLQEGYHSDKSFNYFNINFPAIDYKHIRVVINDKYASSIHIKKTGYFKQKKTLENIKYIPLDYKYSVSQKGKETLIHIKSALPFEINKLAFNIGKPTMFSRSASLFLLDSINDKLEKTTLKNFNISSKTSNILKNLNLKYTDFWLSIDNKDNLPLTIAKINFYQKEKYVVADLVSNENYKIIAGNKKLKTPSYDVINFTDDIDYNLPKLIIKNEQINKTIIQPKIDTKKFYEKPWFMWLSISIVGLIILLFTVSLLKKTDEI